MSALFGKVFFDGAHLDPTEFDRVRLLLAPYGPDGETIIGKDNCGMIFRAFHTTKESRSEVQPYVTPSGVVIAWDGRLDNRNELVHQLQDSVITTSNDLSIVVSAYERWGLGSLAKLVGDWALSIWEPKARSLVLAIDFIGTRHLYYALEKNGITWSTILDPLVLLADHALRLEEEYIAGWLSYFPATGMTPYVGIHAIPPSHFLCVTKNAAKITRYWDFDPAKQIRCHNDGEYEEGFRTMFAQAVKRRLRSDAPVLAELSGGIDSSSIVCVADNIISEGSAQTPKLNTLSYYDDSDPNWNERPYFSVVEQKRGRRGCHVDLSEQQTINFAFDTAHFIATPSQAGECAKQAAEWMSSEGIRIVLSGIGGDEVTGGVPTPIPELADLLARGQLRRLAHSLRVWALKTRRPCVHLFLETIRAFLPNPLGGLRKHMRPLGWFDSDFTDRNVAALLGYPTRLKLLGTCPSFQENISTLENLRRQMGCFHVPLEPLRDVRYPYLDRDFLEFVYAVPREQLLRPGHRRSLMRRALAGIVPDEVLSRKRKGFVSRGGSLQVKAIWSNFRDLNSEPLIGKIGIVDSERFSQAVRDTCNGKDASLITLMRAFALEVWLRSLTKLDAFPELQTCCSAMTAANSAAA